MKLNKILVVSLALVGNAFATDLQPSGIMDYTIKPVVTKNAVRLSSPKHIKLLNVHVSKQALQTIQAKAHQRNLLKAKAKFAQFPAQVQLGMNDVPVLDQGAFGSCVTFANTAAIDAALEQGDYISQLCLLQLTNYMPEHTYASSGWGGSLGRTMLSHLEDHGFVAKETQRQEGCGGLTEYPGNAEPTPTSAISFEDYHKISESLASNGISWEPILDAYRSIFQENDTNEVINDVKTSLNNGKRVTMGVFLPAVDLGVAGAVGKHHESNDAWVLSTLIQRELYLHKEFFFPAHEMIITGYDDNAVAVDDLGQEHKGLLTLRNSWGEDVGDKGDFYMSYDYFQVLALEAQQISYEDAE